MSTLAEHIQRLVLFRRLIQPGDNVSLLLEDQEFRKEALVLCSVHLDEIAAIAAPVAFEAWLTRTCPSGDVTEVQRQWEASSDYADLHEPASQAAPAERHCNKCGYFGPDEMHQRPNGTGQCSYLSCPARAVPTEPPNNAMLMAAHEAIRRALTEAGVRDEILRGMAIAVGLEYFAEQAATPAPVQAAPTEPAETYAMQMLWDDQPHEEKEHYLAAARRSPLATPAPVAAPAPVPPLQGAEIGCTRSHPHEDMSPECERKTIKARADNAERLRELAGEQVDALTDEQCDDIAAAVRSVFGGMASTSDHAGWESMKLKARNLIRATLAAQIPGNVSNKDSCGSSVSDNPVEQAITALVSALADSKGWMRDYADAIVRDAIDRRGGEGEKATEVAKAQAYKSCRMDDGRCGLCGGDWSVCGCDGMLRRQAAKGEGS